MTPTHVLTGIAAAAVLTAAACAAIYAAIVLPWANSNEWESWQ